MSGRSGSEGAGSARVDLESALSRLPGSAGERFATVFERGDVEVEIYSPQWRDLQTPHSRDELYFVVRGTGVFFDGEERKPFAPGEFLFVAAGRPHRFEEFSEDFAVWVVFFGPEDGY